MKPNFYFFANAALGKGLSGSDRIFIEFARIWSKEHKVVIHLWEEGYEMCQRQELTETKNLNFKILKLGIWCKLGFIICYSARIILACKNAFSMQVENSNSTVIYSASEFWMDSLPAFILKLRFPKIRWIAAWFQTAPNPLTGFTKGDRERSYRLSAFYYWLIQVPIKPLIGRYADLILINNEDEKRQFTDKSKLRVILGAVNIDNITNFQKNNKSRTKKYDAVFQGRFHPQKGVVELIEIWRLVTKYIPNAKLAMIGDGPLMKEVKKKIEEYKLEENITLFGYVFDGPKKYQIFSEGKLVVHPAFFDSGGMAAAEAMAFGLPCIGFNLDSYKSYYPQGMIKVSIGDLDEFAKAVINLLQDKDLRYRKGEEARKMILQNWNWNNRIKQINLT